MAVPASSKRSAMRWIVSWSLRFRFLVIAGACALIAVGIVAVRNSPVDVFPEFAPPQVEIQTESLGLSTSDVESLVTVPIELAMNGLPDLTDLRSTSVPQLSSIVMVFKQGTDLIRDRQYVQERLAQVRPTLPRWASPPVMLPPVSATGRVVQIGMYSNKLSVMQLSSLAYWTIKARLLRIDGVADVSIWNEQQPTFQVQVDPAKMKKLGVTLDNVEDTEADALDSGALQFSNGSIVGSGGFVDLPNQRLQVSHALVAQTPADLAKVPLERSPGPKVTLGDVGKVVTGFLPPIGDAVINGGPGLLLVVEKTPWGNTLKVTAAVDQVLKELQPGMPDVHFDPTIFRPATFIDDSIHNLSVSMLIGFILVVVIVMLFLFEWRVALISLVTIPLSLITALLILRSIGATINTMILAGLIIALGAVVDDAIIDVENILRRLRQARQEGSTKPTALVILNASLEVRSPIIYATLIIVAATVPVFLLQGLTASFFRPLMLAYVLAILASLAVALTVTPALMLVVMRNAPLERRGSPIVRWLQDRYERMLRRILDRPRWVYGAFAAITLAGLLVIPTLGQSLFPNLKQRDLLIHWDAIPGTSEAEVVRTTTQLSEQLLAIPGIRNFGAHIGRAKQGEEVVGINAAEIWVSMDPSADYDATLARVRAVVDSYPGLYRDVETYLNERIEEVLSGDQESIIVRVYGQDLAQMRATAQQVVGVMNHVSGVVDQHAALSVDVPQIQVEVDLAKAAKVGVKPGDVRRYAAAMVAGLEVGNTFLDGKVYGVATWSIPSARQSVSSVSDMLVDTPNGGHVRLGDIAKITLGTDPYLITREDNSRYVDIGANVSGRDLGSVVRDIQAGLTGVKLPLGTHYEMLGDYNERQAAQKTLLSTAIIAIIAILLLLQLSFGSWRLAVFTLITLPMALVGGALAVFFGGRIITIGALVGFFTVFGIAARNGILLINHCQHLEDVEGVPFGKDLVLQGHRERLAPILMTSLATGLALVPLLFGADKPGHEIEYPLAVVILGGLLTSTLLTLFVIPSLYLRFGKRHQIQQPASAL
ncbi:MAG TPA: efflux RND transporter permease subunit [Micromonosporaceae bacterium]